MQRAMDRLEAAVAKRRKLVLLAWVVLLLAALPFTLKQTDNLTSGGFVVPGSGSQKVDQAIDDFDQAQRESLAVVLAVRKGGDDAAVRRELQRVDRAADQVEHVSLSRRDRERALAGAGRRPIVVVPLTVSGSQNDTADAATDLRDQLDPSNEPRDASRCTWSGSRRSGRGCRT
jgi:uncharacterized membrane protein YdfJ with MMPL/SSD domain